MAAAAVPHRPIAARYDGTRRFLCPHVVAYNEPGEYSVISTVEKPGADHCRAAMRGSGAVFS